MFVLKAKVLAALIFLQNALCGCHADRRELDFEWAKSGYKARRVFRLPEVVDECSGGIPFTDSTFLTHNDDGEPLLYEVDYKGNLKNTYRLPEARNRDWEDITRDDSGNIYACDVGNNLNLRKDLTIYKYRIGQEGPAKKIEFRYSDQTDFPPDERHQNFDCEAVFWHRDSLYMVSKNRGSKDVKIYAIPDEPGRYVARPVAQTVLRHAVTGADVCPSGTRLGLIAYGEVLLFDLIKGGSYFSHPMACLRFAKSGQAEALWFRTDSTFYVANEGGHVFYFQPRKHCNR